MEIAFIMRFTTDHGETIFPCGAEYDALPIIGQVCEHNLSPLVLGAAVMLHTAAQDAADPVDVGREEMAFNFHGQEAHVSSPAGYGVNAWDAVGLSAQYLIP